MAHSMELNPAFNPSTDPSDPPTLMSLPSDQGGQVLPPMYQEGPLVDELYLSEAILQVRSGKFGNYFLFVNHKYPEKTLRLYKPSAMQLIKHLPEAFEIAKKMELKKYPDECNYTVASINKRNNVEIKLYVQMYQGKAYVFMRMYVEQEDGTQKPSRYGVQISNMDNIQTIINFVNKNKWK